jgi:hypothetical protein
MEHLYRAYLLRLWQASSNDHTVWRASLENPHTGERHAFATLDALFVFLGAETSAATLQEMPEADSGQMQHS